jgi:hypothetical protein
MKICFVRALFTGVAALGLTATFAQGLSTTNPNALQPEFAKTPALPNWNQTHLQAIWDAVRHTAGNSSFEYRWIFASDELKARQATYSGLRNAPIQRAAHLVDVPVGLRSKLVDLYNPGQTTKPIPYTHRDTVGWAVLRLVKRSPVEPLRPGTSFEASARRWVQQGLLPDPEVLLSDPRERARVAYWNARTTEAVAAIAPDLGPNVRYGNQLTPLTLAVITQQRAIAQALIDRGADLSLCSPVGCPLGIAAVMGEPAQALEWTQWLLARGAPVDGIDLQYFLSSRTPLAISMIQGFKPVVEALVTAKASPDGVPHVQTTPIESAASNKHRDLVEWLIAHGASVLPFRDRSGETDFERGNLYLAALSTGDQAFATWAESTVISAAEKSPAMRFAAFIEQGKRRVELANDADISLQAAPFKLVLAMRPEQADSVMVGASLNPAWLEEARRGDRRNPMFRLYTSAALTPTPEPESYELLVGQPCVSDAKPTDVCPGVLWHLNRDSSARADFHEVRAAKYEYVREYRSIVDASKEKPGPAKPLQAFAGQTLYLVLASTLELGGPDSKQILVTPRFVRVKLQK